MLSSIGPIDGRYSKKTSELQQYFSEGALIKYRILVEIKYFIALSNAGIPNFKPIDYKLAEQLLNWATQLSDEDCEAVKKHEAVTNHDVKAVEYFIKDNMDSFGINEAKEWIHFGLTSQDINNTAFPMMIRDAIAAVMLPGLDKIVNRMKDLESEYEGIPMLARTHGQPASPTTLGKEFRVFRERIEIQMEQLKSLKLFAKFGGATGNFNAHKVALGDIDWIGFANNFVEKDLGLTRYQTTTQIAHYDDLAGLFDVMKRINTIFIDLCRDIWTYIAMDYFKQKLVKGEVGSSAMPHKVNPIDFENAEGNLGMANAIYQFLSGKLPISRLQRDLTDSTVLRNVGVPFAHSLIAFKSLLKGLSKLDLNRAKLEEDLNNNMAVLAEAIQTVLRRESFPKPYEALKELTRGNSRITKEIIDDFIDGLAVNDNIKAELKAITPSNYTGYN